MKIVIQTFLVLSLFCMIVNAREGKTFRQEMAEKRAQDNCRSMCCEYQPMISAMEVERPKPVERADVTAEQRDMMRMYNLSVPPVIMPMERQVKIAEKPKVVEQSIFSAMEPIREIKITVDEKLKPVELTIKKELPKAEIIEIPKPKESVKADFKPTQEQLDTMKQFGLTVPPTMIGSNNPKMPDIAVAPQEIKAQAQVVVELNDSNFESQIAKGTCIVEFGASWCQPCREMAPIYESVMLQHGNILAFHIDVDSCPNTKAHQGISSFPTFVMYSNGKRLDSRIGKMPREEFDRWVK